MGASSICHPLDTIKVRLQTQTKQKIGIVGNYRTHYSKLLFVIN